MQVTMDPYWSFPKDRGLEGLAPDTAKLRSVHEVPNVLETFLKMSSASREWHASPVIVRRLNRGWQVQSSKERSQTSGRGG